MAVPRILHRWIVAATLCLATPLVAQASAPELRPIGAVVNGSGLPEPGMLLVQDGQLFVRLNDLRQWGLTPQLKEPALTFEGEEFVRLQGLAGVTLALDAEGANVLITADGPALPHRVIATPATARPLSPIVPAQFLGYDLTLSSWQGQTRLTGLFDGGLSGKWGAFTTTALLTGQGSRLVRLDTALRRDFPERRLRLVIGDTVSQPAGWSAPVRFGGIQFGTDFALDPQAINFPLPTIGGSAAVPSTVELLSEAQHQSFNADPGSFDVTLQPRMTGAGQVTMTIRDAAGSVREVARSFYTSPDLLRPGRSAFVAEAGLLRRGYGFAGQHYGPFFAAAGLRQSLANWITGQARVETGGGTTVAGLGGSMVVGALAEISLSGAVSHDAGAWGGNFRVQARRITADYSLSAAYETADRDFRGVGQGSVQNGGRRELVVAGSANLGPIGDLSISHASLRQGIGTAEPRSFAISSLSISRSLAGGYLGAGLQRTTYNGTRHDGPAWSWFATWSRQLGPRSTLSFSSEPGRLAAIYDQDAPDSGGLGGHMLVGKDDSRAWLEGNLAARTAAGDLDLKAARRRGGEGVQLSARGSLIHIDGSLLAAPRLADAFALVKVESGNPVTVTLENRPQARRAGNGQRTILTGLQPYAPNRIGIDPADLLIEDAVTIEGQLVVPGWRQAAAVRFGGAGRHPALVHVVDSQGQPIPLGGLAEWTGGSGTIGYDGAVWIDDYQAGQRLTASYSGKRCQAHLPAVASPRQLVPVILSCTPFIEAEPVL